MRRAFLAVLIWAIVVAQPVAAAEGEGGGSRQAVSGGQSLRFDMPTGLCRIDPSRGGVHAEFWRRFTPRAERKAELLALDLDCETVRAADDGRLQRPARIAHLLNSTSDEEDGGSLPKMLAMLEQRFGRLARERGTPLPENDGRAVYVQQLGGEKSGETRLIGMSAFTLVAGQRLIFTIIDFGGSMPLAELRAATAKAVETLQMSRR